MRTVEDPTEKRRAATTLLRAIANQLHPTRAKSELSGARRRTSKTSHDPIEETDDDLLDESEDASDDELDDDESDGDVDVLHLPEGGGREEGPGAAASNPPSAPSEPALSTQASALSPAPTLSIPVAYARGQLQTHPDCPLPDPLRKPEDVIEAVLHAIHDPCKPTYSSGPLTIYNLAGNIATRTHDHFETFSRTTLEQWFAGAWHFKSRGPISPIQNNRATVHITTRTGRDAKLHFELHRPESGTLASCWLLKRATCERTPEPDTSDPNTS